MDKAQTSGLGSAVESGAGNSVRATRWKQAWKAEDEHHIELLSLQGLQHSGIMGLQSPTAEFSPRHTVDCLVGQFN